MRRDPSRWWVLVVVVGAACVPVAALLGWFLSATVRLAVPATAAGPRVGPGAVRELGLGPTTWAGVAVVAVGAGPGLAAGLYRDASAVRRRTNWAPRARWWGAGGLCYPLSALVGLWYLVRRYRRVGLLGLPVRGSPTRAELAASGRTRVIAAGPVAVPAVGGACLSWALRVGAGGVVRSVIWLVVGLLVVTLLYAGYAATLVADATHVWASEVDWTPRVEAYRLVLGTVPLLGLLAGMVYLYGRRRHVDA